PFSYTVAQGQNTLGSVALQLAALIHAAGYGVQTTPGSGHLLIWRPGGAAFSVSFGVVPATGQAASGSATINPGTLNTSTLSFADGTIDWQQADVTLTGLPNVGDVWTLTLDGTPISYIVAQGDDVASRVALQLASLVPGGSLGYHVEPRVGILGDSQLLITRNDGTP